MIDRIAKLIINHPWPVLLLTVTLVFIASAGLTRLDFKSDYRVFFSEDNPQLKAFNAIQDTYSKSDNVLFVIESGNGDIFNPVDLEAIRLLTEKSWQIPHATRVDSISNFQHTVSADDDLIVADLVGDSSLLSASEIASIKKIALSEPLLVNRLISERGHVSGVNVTVQLSENSAEEAWEITAASRMIADEIEARYPGVKVYLTGIVVMNNAFIEAALNDNTVLTPLMLAVVVGVLLLCLRSISASFCTIVLILFSILSALGLFGWLGGDITLASAAAPIIILTMAVADCVHFLVAMLHDMRMRVAKTTAIKNSFRVNFHPMLLTSVTTAIGFLSLNFSDAPPYRDLGNVVAMGVIIAFGLSLTFLPAAMTLLPVRVRLAVVSEQTIMKRLGRWVTNRRIPLLVIGTLFSVTMASFSALNELNDELIEYFDRSIEFRRATDFLNHNMGGIYTVEFALDTRSDGGINEPVFLNDANRFVQWLKSQPETIHVNSITDTFKRLNRSMHDDDPTAYRLPEQRDMAAQYLLMYEMSLPYGLDLNDQVDIGKSAIRIVATTENLSSNRMLALEQRAGAWLSQNMPAVQFEIASPGLMFSHIGKRNIGSMVIGTIAALGFISLILLFAFRSLKLGLISLAPNLLPAGIAFGLWGLIDGQINLGLSIVVGMTLGIVVDDTVHFISKYRRARIDKGLNSEDAVLYAFTTVGNAMWITSAVLTSGFLVLCFSDFTMNADMGLLTAITIATALIMDLFFLPPLLICTDKVRSR